MKKFTKSWLLAFTGVMMTASIGVATLVASADTITYQAETDYDATTTYIEEQTETSYQGVSVIPFTYQGTWWDENVFAANAIGTGSFNAAKLTTGSVVVLDFQQPIPTADFAKISITLGSNGGSTFEAYNVNEITDGALGSAKTTLSVPHWGGQSFTFNLADYADASGNVDAIAFKMTGGVSSGAAELELVVSGFSLAAPQEEVAPEEKEISVVNIHKRVNELMFFLSESDYTGSTVDYNNKAAEISASALDNILIYTDAENYVSLRTAHNASGSTLEHYLNLWGDKNTIAFALGTEYSGENIYAVKIPADTEFFAQTEGTVFVTTQDVTYRNQNYNTVVKDGDSDWYISWTAVDSIAPPADTPDDSFYKEGVAYDATSEYVKAQTGTTYNGVSICAFADQGSWWDSNVFPTNAIGTNTFNAVHLVDGSVVVIEFVNPISANDFDIVTLLLGSNGGASFETYNVNEITDGALGEAKNTIFVPHWSANEINLNLADYADSTGNVSAIALKMKGAVNSGATELEIAISGFSLVKELPAEADTEITLANNLHIRADVKEDGSYQTVKMLFFLNECDYDLAGNTEKVLPTGVVYDDLTQYNTLDNILLWTSETEYITLREAHDGNPEDLDRPATKEVYYNCFGESKVIAFDISGYNGLSFTKITVLGGCEFPSVRAIRGEINTDKAYVNTETVNYIDWHVDETFSTNWRYDNEVGKTEISSVAVDAQNGVLSYGLTNNDYPTDAERFNIDTNHLEEALTDNYTKILLNGVKLEEVTIYETDADGKSYFNYGANGVFGLELPGYDVSQITQVIFLAGCQIPAFNNTNMGIEDYGVMYYIVPETVMFVKNDSGVFEKAESISWSVQFGDVETREVVDGEKLGSLPTATLAGHKFLGWYNGQAKVTENTVVRGKLVLTAKFVKVYTATFNSDGGTEVESQMVEEGESFVAPTEPTKDGYTFKGWYNGDVAYDFNAVPEEDVTLTAKWEKNAGSAIGFGCFGTVDASIVAVLLLLPVAVAAYRRKERNN